MKKKYFVLVVIILLFCFIFNIYINTFNKNEFHNIVAKTNIQTN